MNLKQKLKLFIKKVEQLPTLMKILIVIFLFVLFFYSITFLPEKSIQFSYDSNSCVRQLTLLPSLNKPTDSSLNFEVKNYDIIKLGNVQLISLKTCFSAKKAPSVGNATVSTSLFGSWFAKNTVKLSIPNPPVVVLTALSQPLSTKKTLIMNLTKADSVFNYQIKIDSRYVPCNVKSLTMTCDISSLNLLQGKEYNLELFRMFGSKIVSILTSKNIKTIEATNVISSSISDGQVIYDNPKTFTFGFDKEVIKGSVTLNKVDGDKLTAIESSAVFNGKQVIVTPKSDLGRDSLYRISIDLLEAKDTSTLPSPYKIDFSLSDGPIVISVNVGASGIPSTKTIILTFDQTLSVDQNVTKFISVSGVSSVISRTGNKVSISYANAPMCTDIRINVSAGVMNNYNIIQNNPWSFTTRTICHSILTIGYSKEGRPITAYVFGSGNQTILYTGSIHGNELSAKYLMDAWVNELEANERNIPAGRKLVVIPTLNPDGVAADSRNNSDNVDLNRNFPTADWQADIVSPSNQPIPSGGGITPMSEPESQAIATFTAQLSPRLTMSFHSSAGYVIGNQAGDSSALAALYSQISGYRNMTGVSDAFSYPITGTYDDWMREAYGLTSVLVELSSSSNSEFYKNKDALWTMARS